MNIGQLILFGFFCLCLLTAEAQEGTLDSLFGVDGVNSLVINNQSTRGVESLLLNDNSILLGVNSEVSMSGAIFNRGFYIFKLLPNGLVDINFGNDGQLYFPHDDHNESKFRSFKLLDNNRVLIQCTIADSANLVRIHLNGEIDESFGNDGFFSVVEGSNMGIQSDCKIVVQSQFYDGSNNLYRFTRYLADGSLDEAFGDNGSITHDISNYRFDLCAAITVQEDDKIIAVGRSYDSAVYYHASISRFNEDGTIDVSFGDNGTVITDLSSTSEFGEFMDVDIFSNRIIAAGIMQYSGGTGGFGGSSPVVVSFNKNGGLDDTFGDQGKVLLETIYGANDRLRTVKVQSDGKIVVGGGASYPFPVQQTNFFVTRLNIDGSIDSVFGIDGTFVTNFENIQESSNYATDIELQLDGSILAFGVTADDNGEFRNATICRLKNESLETSESTNRNDIVIFPNPTTDLIWIRSSESIENIEVFNSIGQLVHTGEELDSCSEFMLDMRTYASGVYEIQVHTAKNEVSTNKIIKE